MKPESVKNVSGESIPAWAAMEIVDHEYRDGVSVWHVDKPSESNLRPEAVLFNGPQAIPSDKYGAGERSCLARAAVDDAAEGDTLGTVEDSWELGEGNGFWRLKDIADSDSAIVTAELHGTFMGKADGEIAAMEANTPGTGTVTLWRFKDDGDVEATSHSIEAVNLSAATVSAGVMLQGKKIQGRNVIDFESCEAGGE